MELLSNAQIGLLSPSERLSLIARLWDSLVDDELPVSPAQQTELDRRLASLDADRAETVAWVDLKDELERLCP